MKPLIGFTIIIFLIGHVNTMFCPVHEVTSCDTDKPNSALKSSLQSTLNGIDCFKADDIESSAPYNLYFNGKCNSFGKSFTVQYYNKKSSISCFGFDETDSLQVLPCQCVPLVKGELYRVAFGDEGPKSCSDTSYMTSYSDVSGTSVDAGPIVGGIVGLCCCVALFFICKKICKDSDDKSDSSSDNEESPKKEERSEAKQDHVPSPSNIQMQYMGNNMQPMMQQPMMQHGMQPGMMPSNPMMMQQQPIMQPMVGPMMGMPMQPGMQPVMQPMIDPMTGMPMQPVMQPMIDPATGMPMQPVMQPMIDPMTGLPIQQPGMQPVMQGQPVTMPPQ